VFETAQSLEQQQELLELETENERLLLNILPRHVVPFFMPSRHHGQVCFPVSVCGVTCWFRMILEVLVLSEYSAYYIHDTTFCLYLTPV